MKPKLLIISIITACLIYSCLNRFEETAIGSYSIQEYKLIDSSKNINLPKFQLRKDRTFSLEISNMEYNGKWKVTDIQEFTTIYFNFNDNHICEGRIWTDNGNIDILNPYADFYLPNVASITFKKVK